jgi:hypothetical protein
MFVRGRRKGSKRRGCLGVGSRGRRARQWWAWLWLVHEFSGPIETEGLVGGWNKVICL